MKTEDERIEKDSEMLIRELVKVLDRWEDANKDKSKYYIKTALLSALMSMLWGSCMFYGVSINEILSKIVKKQEAEKMELAARMGNKDELH